MPFTNRYLEIRSTLADPQPWLMEALGGGKVASGVVINEETAMQSTAVLACVRILAETIASLPLPVYRRLAGGGKERATDHYLYSILHDQPNPEMTSFEFREALMGHLALWGNAYAEVVRDEAGRVGALWPLRPDRMRVSRDDQGLRYEYILPDGTIAIFRQQNIMHIRGLSSDGIVGYSPIRLAREAIGLTLATEEFGARFFGQGSRPSGILEHPGRLSPEAKKNLRESWEEMHSGLTGAHRIAILEEGLTWRQIGIPPEDAQFLQCVVPDTLLTMADGSLRAARDIREGDRVMAWDGGPVVARVAAVGKPPIKPLVRIRTARGRELTASYDHPVLAKRALRTQGGRPDTAPEAWIPISELQVGNYIRVGLGSVELPDQMPFEVAWMLGAMVGDGYIRAGQSSFSTANTEIAAALQDVLATLGGSMVRSRHRKYDWLIRTGGRGRGGSLLRTLFNDAGLTGAHAHTKRVPYAVMTGGPSAWRGFLSGYLDTDGSVRPVGTRQQPAVHWHSVNRDLLADCQHLLALLGVQSAIYRMVPAGKRLVMGQESDAHAGWGLYVTGAEQLRRLAALLSPKHSEKAARLAAFKDLQATKYRHENWLYDRVVSVEYLGPGETVGIEIEGVHTHITGGIVTHNTRRFQIEEIARIYRIPPHMLADLERATFSNVEQLAIEFVVHTIRPWLVRWEQAIKRDLFLPGERETYFAEFLVDGLLRGDTESRYRAYSVARQWGWMSANDVRELENMNPIPGGDIYLIPLNMVPAAGAGETQRSIENRFLPISEERALRSANIRRGIANSYKKIIATTVQRILKREMKDIMTEAEKAFGKRAIDPSNFYAWLHGYYNQKHAPHLDAEMWPVFSALAEAVNVSVGDEIGVDTAMTPELEEFVRDYTNTYRNRHIGKSITEIKDALQKTTYEYGGQIEALKELFQKWGKRPEEEGQEEGIRATNAVALTAYMLHGVPQVRWVSVGTSCPYCLALDGQTVNTNAAFVKMGEEFKPDGADAPLIPSRNTKHPPLHRGCDCMLVSGLSVNPAIA